MLINGTWGILLNTLTITATVFFAAYMVSFLIISQLNQRFYRYRPSARKLILWLMVLLPWLSALLASTIFVIVCLYFPKAIGSTQGYHWHHISLFEIASWHSIPLCALILWGAGNMIKKGFEVYAHYRAMQGIKTFSKRTDSGYYLLENDATSAFTAGFITPRCFFGNDLWSNLSNTEQDVILGHEYAHISNFDPLKKWLFSFFAMFYPPVFSKRLQDQMTMAMEQAADNAVHQSGINTLHVASTLIKVARLQQDRGQKVNENCIANFAAELLEQRINFLLGNTAAQPINISLTVISMIGLLLFCVSSFDGIHHLIEQFFSHG